MSLVKSMATQDHPEVVALLEGVARKGIVLVPRHLGMLTTLGVSQLSQYNGSMGRGFSPGTAQWKAANTLLTDAECSFRAAISVEKASQTGDVPAKLAEQSWWTHATASETKANGAAPKAADGKGGAPGKGGGARGARGGTAGTRAGSRTLGAVAGRRGGAATSSLPPSSSSSAPAAKAGRRAAPGPSSASSSGPAAGRRATGGTKSVSLPSSSKRKAPVAGRRASGAFSSSSSSSSSSSASTGRAGAVAGRRASGAAASSTVGKSGVAKSSVTPVGRRVVSKALPAKDGGDKTVANKKGAGAAGRKGGGNGGGGVAAAKKGASDGDGGSEGAAEDSILNGSASEAKLGLARVLRQRLGDGRTSPDVEASGEMIALYEAAIASNPNDHDPVIELGEFLVTQDPMKAVALYDDFPCVDPPTFDDGYIHGEVVRILLKEKEFGDARLERHMVGSGKVNGVNSLNKEIHILDEQFKYSKMLMRIYAAINQTSVEDPELQDFFKIKCWV